MLPSSLAALIELCASAAGVSLLTAFMSLIVEQWNMFQGLTSTWKRAIMYGTPILVSMLALVVKNNVSVELLTMLEPYYQLAMVGVAGILAGQGWHLAINKAGTGVLQIVAEDTTIEGDVNVENMEMVKSDE